MISDLKAGDEAEPQEGYDWLSSGPESQRLISVIFAKNVIEQPRRSFRKASKSSPYY
jgi:hypothetical protein